MRNSLLLLIVALQMAACGGSTTAPSTPPPVVVPPVVVPPPPTIVQMIETVACPTSGPVDLNFFREMACNAFENPLQPVRRWTRAPKVYLKTVDEAGAPIDALTLDTVQNAMIEIAPTWTHAKFGLEGVLRGTESREGVSGWITVKWPATASAFNSCGLSQVATDGGWIQLNYLRTTCTCGGSKIYPRLAAHELGHAFGYYHTDSQADVMFGQTPLSCDASPSARELQSIAYHYR